MNGGVPAPGQLNGALLMSVVGGKMCCIFTVCFVFLSFSEMPGERRSPGARPAERSSADECGGRKDERGNQLL